MIRAGRCNVLSEVRSGLNYLAYSNVESKDLGFVVGAKTLSKEPLAIVTRQNDREFSDIINWVMQALFFGEEQALQTIHHFAKIIQPPLDFNHLT